MPHDAQDLGEIPVTFPTNNSLEIFGHKNITIFQQVVKAIWHKAAWTLQTNGSNTFTRWQQCVLRQEHIGATWRIRWNMCFLRPNQSTTQMANRSVQPYLHSSWQSVILTLSMRRSGPPYNTWFPGPTQVLNPNGILIGSAVFAGLNRPHLCT